MLITAKRLMQSNLPERRKRQRMLERRRELWKYVRQQLDHGLLDAIYEGFIEKGELRSRAEHLEFYVDTSDGPVHRYTKFDELFVNDFNIVNILKRMGYTLKSESITKQVKRRDTRRFQDDYRHQMYMSHHMHSASKAEIKKIHDREQQEGDELIDVTEEYLILSLADKALAFMFK